MKVLVLGDTHIWNHSQLGGPMEGGLNRRCRDLIRDIRDTVEGAKSNFGVKAVVQLGDFFDKSNPPPAVMNAAMGLIKESGIPWHIIAGNHDIRSFGAPSAITPLGKLEGCFVYDEPKTVEIGGVGWAMVPFTARTAAESVNALRDSAATFACLHYGCVLSHLASGRPDTISVLEIPPNLPLCFFGHEHGSRARRDNATSLGSFAQFNFGDPLIGYIAAIADTSLTTQRWRHICSVAGPRFVDLRAVDFGMCSLHGSFLDTFSTEATNVYCIFKPEDAKLAERLVEVGIVTDYRIAPLEAPASQDEDSLFEPEKTSTVDVDRCVLEELMSKLPEQDIPKAWEFYESIARS